MMTLDAFPKKEDADSTPARVWEHAVFVERDGVWVMHEDSYWGSYSVAVTRYMRVEEPACLVSRLVSPVEVVE